MNQLRISQRPYCRTRLARAAGLWLIVITVAILLFTGQHAYAHDPHGAAGDAVIIEKSALEPSVLPHDCNDDGAHGTACCPGVLLPPMEAVAGTISYGSSFQAPWSPVGRELSVARKVFRPPMAV